MKNPFENQRALPSPEELLESTKISKSVWEINKRNGVEVIRKDDAWHGYSKKGGDIEIGTQPVPEEIKSSWGISELPDREAKTYILSHENMHFILWKAFDNPAEFPEIRNLLNTISAMRKNTSTGLSRLGNMDMYGTTGRNTAHEEDVIELMNMYGISPQNLRDYLTWLTDTDREALQAQRLFKIPSKEVADAIFNQVSATVNRYIEG